jgi:hypothetical protein
MNGLNQQRQARIYFFIRAPLSNDYLFQVLRVVIDRSGYLGRFDCNLQIKKKEFKIENEPGVAAITFPVVLTPFSKTTGVCWIPSAITWGACWTPVAIVWGARWTPVAMASGAWATPLAMAPGALASPVATWPGNWATSDANEFGCWRFGRAEMKKSYI